MRDRMAELLDGFDGSLSSIFSTKNRQHTDDYFFESAETISFFEGMLCSLDHKRPVVVQSMYIFKQPGIGGEVVPHQDNSFLYTDPPSCTGLWLALEDMQLSLMVVSGPSLAPTNGLKRRFIRDENGVHFNHPSPSYDHKDFVPLEVKAGSLVVIHVLRKVSQFKACLELACGGYQWTCMSQRQLDSEKS